MNFNLNELRLDSKKYAFIYPAEFEKLDTFFSSVPFMMDILDVYCMVKDRHYGEEGTLLTKLKHKMRDRLDLPNERYETIDLNKIIKLNIG